MIARFLWALFGALIVVLIVVGLMLAGFIGDADAAECVKDWHSLRHLGYPHYRVIGGHKCWYVPGLRKARAQYRIVPHRSMPAEVPPLPPMEPIMVPEPPPAAPPPEPVPAMMDVGARIDSSMSDLALAAPHVQVAPERPPIDRPKLAALLVAGIATAVAVMSALWPYAKESGPRT